MRRLQTWYGQPIGCGHTIGMTHHEPCLNTPGLDAAQDAMDSTVVGGMAVLLGMVMCTMGGMLVDSTPSMRSLRGGSRTYGYKKLKTPCHDTMHETGAGRVGS